ncbi:metallophosphoesterase family protein [Paenibacillus sp. J5C_2022]|uniref:metallophosphoesterase family protein n=1 Tax=Paenibacillus sp. J5C2022 TaxID=2977129 RepID=UPI0021CFC2BC|nr:metallophosphoesterase family protein [Paenibacillus sp. J5C2022]MCU6707325.1 metallophosphoesterase family protein [Paenibacillus sp. J5C2022]
MRVLIVSDEESKYIWDHYEPDRFKGVELIISCGDLKAEYLSFLVTMINAPLFYVHGNHDISYKVHPPEGCECIDGKLIHFKGLRILGLGGSHRYNLCHRGFECFVAVMDRYQPTYLLHGHQHLNYGRNQRIHQYVNTKIINAFGYHILDIS